LFEALIRHPSTFDAGASIDAEVPNLTMCVDCCDIKQMCVASSGMAMALDGVAMALTVTEETSDTKLIPTRRRLFAR
jgi:hypothetical protein